MNLIPVVDLFAGPGGLGEGFSSLRNGGAPVFDIRLSVEKDSAAHQTLRLRSFFRRFNGDVPAAYYELLRGERSLTELYAVYPGEAASSHHEAWHAELGQVTDRSVRERVRIAIGGSDPWVLIGGPPCQAYSVAGRARNNGVEGYRPHLDHRQTLYVEYLKVIADHWPAVFVMENVPGLLSARLDGKRLLKRIVEDLSDPARALNKRRAGRHTYELYGLGDDLDLFDGGKASYVVSADHFGVPQTRRRVILIGVRSDHRHRRPTPMAASATVPVAEVLDGLPRVRSGISPHEDSSRRWVESVQRILHKLGGIRRAAGPEVADRVEDLAGRLRATRAGRGGRFVARGLPPKHRPEWFSDERLEGVCNHETKAHMEKDLHRYLFCCAYASVTATSPRLTAFPRSLLPDHENVERALKSRWGVFSDRFRVQLPRQPATTITSHIQKDGHYYIHYDGTQCRSLTVREAARIQTFPDNYYFCGSRTSQFGQVGNAVPPLLALAIAESVSRILV